MDARAEQQATGNGIFSREIAAKHAICRYIFFRGERAQVYRRTSASLSISRLERSGCSAVLEVASLLLHRLLNKFYFIFAIVIESYCKSRVHFL